MSRAKYVPHLLGFMVVVLVGSACGSSSEVVRSTASTETTTISASPLILEQEPAEPEYAGAGRVVHEAETERYGSWAPKVVYEAETERYVYQLPASVLTNPGNLLTSLGKLCWSLTEFLRMTYLELIKNIVASTPIEGVVYLDSDGKETTEGITDYSFLDALEEIQRPEVLAVLNDPELSEELKLYAKAFFDLIAATEVQARAVGWENIDNSKLPYQDYEDLPHLDAYSEAIMDNPGDCVLLPDEEIEALE